MWKTYFENSDKAFDCTPKKLEKIKTFLMNYQILGNSLNQLKKNINLIKKVNSSSNKSSNEEGLKNFLEDLQAIKGLNPNLKENYTLTYEFYKGMIHFYVDSKNDQNYK